METIRILGRGGLALDADIAGPDSGPAVVLLHGGGQTRHAWSRAFHALAEAGYRVLSYDARGHGGSAWDPEGDYSTDALVADLCAVQAHLAAPVALVGASMGGITSLTAIGEGALPDAAALVLVDVAPHIRREGVARIRAFMTARPEGFANLEEVADAVAAYNPERPRPRDPSGLMKNLRTGTDGRLYWHWDPRIISDRFDEHAAYLDTFETRMTAAARAVAVPTMLVRGTQSDVVSAEGAERLQALIPDARIEDVGGAGHMVAGDRNDAFNAVVMEFLATVYAESGSA
ncbi:alpha/beta fold hydrolase [Algiphilus sp.]|uniref:alpha/beta fold hydrolase n=1 Tax=Algiphilus sp. TaxID=1872431 RepID=UPI003B52E1C5